MDTYRVGGVVRYTGLGSLYSDLGEIRLEACRGPLSDSIPRLAEVKTDVSKLVPRCFFRSHRGARRCKRTGMKPCIPHDLGVAVTVSGGPRECDFLIGAPVGAATHTLVSILNVALLFTVLTAAHVSAH